MNRIKLRLLNWLAKHLFKLITEDEFLKFNQKDGKIYLRGNPLTKDQMNSISEQAKTIQSLELWGLLMKEMTFIANKKIALESTSINDVLGGKYILYTLDVLSRKVYNLSNQK